MSNKKWLFNLPTGLKRYSIFGVFWYYSSDKTDMVQILKSIFPFSGTNFKNCSRKLILMSFCRKLGKFIFFKHQECHFEDHLLRCYLLLTTLSHFAVLIEFSALIQRTQKLPALINAVSHLISLDLFASALFRTSKIHRCPSMNSTVSEKISTESALFSADKPNFSELKVIAEQR